MNDQTDKYEFVFKQAKALRQNRRNGTIDFAELARRLNGKGYTTKKGTAYVLGGRGMASLVDLAYGYVNVKYSRRDADKIAKAFVNKSGKYAWRHPGRV